MRFNNILLTAYGPFTNASIDLRKGEGKLEVIYGPNEAGKSSLLRAISDFLFGIPGQTHDNFVHPYGNLRIQATIERTGDRLECVRRKATANSLRAADTDEPISEERLHSFVPIESRDVFHAMFGLNAERLQQGSEELLKGQSEFGQLLFSAAAGIAGLHDILKRLNDDADKLFKPRASSAVIPRMLGLLKEAKGRLRQAQVSLTDLNKLQEDYQTARETIIGLESEILAKQSETERYKRIQISLGLLRRRTEIREQLRSVESVPLLRDEFADDYQKAASDLIIKAGETRVSKQRVDDLREQLKDIVLSVDLLPREREILYFYQRSGAQTKAADDRRRLQDDVHQVELDMTQILRKLGESLDLDRVPDLVVNPADKRMVQELSTLRASLDTDIRTSGKSLAEERQDLESARQQLGGLPVTKPVGSLRDAVQEALLAEATEEKARRLQNTVMEESWKLNEEVDSLPWPSSVEALEVSPLPSDQVVAEWTRRLDKAEQAIDHADERLRSAKADVSRLENDLAALLAGHSVPALSQLGQERKYRDLGWRAVRSAWLQGDIRGESVREFMQDHVDAPSLAKAYEDTVAKTDNTADKLREDADQVAKLEQCRVAIDGARKEAHTCEEELKNVRESFDRSRTEWEGLWTPFHVKAGDPRQMASWLQLRATILERLRAVEEKKTQAGEYLDEAEVAKRQLQECLSAIGESSKPSSDSLIAWRLIANNVLQEQDDLANRREKLDDKIDEGERTVMAAEIRLSNANANLDGWKQKWGALMTNLGLPADTEPSVAQEVVGSREELQAHFQTAIGYRARIAGIDRDENEFRHHLHQLLDSVASDLLSKAEAEAIGELHQRLGEAKKQQELHRTKEKDLEREIRIFETAEREREKTQNQLAALASEAGCTHADQLRPLIEESKRRKELEKGLREVEQQLVAIGVGRSISKLEEEAKGVESDQIPGQLELIDLQIQESRGQLKSNDEKRITLENELKRMADASDCCAASSDIEAYKTELVEAVEQYVCLQIARIVLQGAVDQYREKTQSDMLKRSSELFSLLTGGAFSGLRLDWDDVGNVVLVGVRTQMNENLGLSGMSDGTRDQLYLALRLASVELYTRDHEPIPFILDDILVKFDDERAVAAIHALAELAQHTQVLLFTHHKHLVNLARDNLDTCQLAILDLGYRSGSVSPKAMNS